MYSSLALNTELAYISNKSKQWDLQIAIHLEYAAFKTLKDMTQKYVKDLRCHFA